MTSQDVSNSVAYKKERRERRLGVLGCLETDEKTSTPEPTLRKPPSYWSGLEIPTIRHGHGAPSAEKKFPFLGLGGRAPAKMRSSPLIQGEWSGRLWGTGGVGASWQRCGQAPDSGAVRVRAGESARQRCR
ncbi:hypothetical protein NDU88_002796 [Pleurodeles waltl]|uniref:Uncharacterized protein n=1 Tax=Pleurodeles waltl TaxID=8319 RepID=A0AAV7LF34_PLEWA|nr:hypothetical protein NDU88_002796 [Pleurodeles waltl]